MADPHQNDPIAQANQDIRDFIQSIGGRIRPEHRPEYERRVRVYFAAIAARDEARDAEPEPEPLAA